MRTIIDPIYICMKFIETEADMCSPWIVASRRDTADVSALTDDIHRTNTNRRYIVPLRSRFSSIPVTEIDNQRHCMFRSGRVKSSFGRFTTFGNFRALTATNINFSSLFFSKRQLLTFFRLLLRSNDDRTRLENGVAREKIGRGLLYCTLNWFNLTRYENWWMLLIDNKSVSVLPSDEVCSFIE